MGFIVKAVKSVFKAIGSVFKGILSIFGVKKPKTPTNTATNSRLNKTLNPDEPRKIVFGHTASALDQRYWEVFGTNSDHFDEIIACASHTIDGFEDLWGEDEIMINAAGVVQGAYAGLLTRTTNDGTQGPLSVGTGAHWGANSKFTGVAHMALHWIVDDKKMPKGLPSRLTQRIRGAKVYDPRKDSTRGGSGTHRADDQTTWEYAPLDSNGVPIGRNNALQILWYLIGWRITSPQTGEKILVCGRGLDLNDIDFNQFILAANAAEAAQYYTDCILSTGDSHSTNEAVISADGLIGRVLDVGGLWGYFPNVDDTAAISVYLTDDDIADMGSVEWNEFSLPLSESYNSVSGSFVDNSDTSLYQTRPYPIVRDTGYEATDGFKRTGKKDLQSVQDVNLAQRLARLMVNAAHWQGVFQATFKHRALAAQAWSVVSYTSERFGWTKLFRVTSMGIQIGGGIDLQLREVTSAIWTAGVIQPSTTPVPGVRYNWNSIINPTAVTISAATFTGSNGVVLDGATITWGTVPPQVKSVEVRYRVLGAIGWNYSVQQQADGSTAGNLGPLISGTTYEINVRFVTNYGVIGAWVAPASNYVAGTSGNVLDGRVGVGLNSSGQVMSAAVGDANRVRFSLMEGVTKGWSTTEDSGLTTALSKVTSSGVPYLKGVQTFTANNQLAEIGTDTGVSVISITPGERLFVGAMLGTDPGFPAGASWALFIGWLNAAGGEIAPRTLIAQANGSIAAFARYGAFVNAPAGAVGAFLRFNLYTNTSGFTGAMAHYLGQPMVCSAGANQTSWPAFTPGPSNEAGATLGATWGSTGNVSSVPTPLVNVTNSTYVDNSLVAIGSNGALTVGGGGTGGQVTITGLGYSGALNATYGASWGTLGSGAGGTITGVPTNVQALTGSEDVRNDYMSWSQDFGGTGGRLRLGVTTRGALIGAYVTPDDRIQNLGITVGSGRLSGIGAGNLTYVDNSIVSIGANGAMTNGAGGGGQVTANGMGIALGVNSLINSEFTLIDAAQSTIYPVGFQAAWNGNGGMSNFTDTRVALADGSFAFARTCNGTPAVGTALDGLTQNYVYYRRFLIPCQPGDVFAISCLAAGQNLQGVEVELQFHDETGTYSGEVGGAVTPVFDMGSTAFTAVSRSQMTRISYTVTIPADGGAGTSASGRVRWIRFNTRTTVTGGANPRILIAAPMIAKIPAGQTTLPAYIPGPGDRSATFGAIAGSSGSLYNSDGSLIVSADNSQVGGYTALGDANRVRYSQIESTKGFTFADTTVGLTPSLSSGVSAGVGFYQGTIAFTAAGQGAALGNDPCLIPVVAGERLFVGAMVGNNLPAAGTWAFQIGWINSAGVEISSRTLIASGTGTIGWPTRIGGFATVPAGAVKAFLRYLIANNSAGAVTGINYVWGQVQVCSAGASQTAWPAFTPGPANDIGATVGATAGTDIRSSSGTVLGDGDVINQFGVNQLINSDLNRGLLGFQTSTTGGNPGGTGSVAVNTLAPTYAGMRNVLQAHMPINNWGPTNGGGQMYWDFAWVKSAGWNGFGSISDMQNYCIRVKQGDNVFVRCLGAQHRCVLQMYVILYDKGGSWIETQGPWGGARDGGGTDGNPANFNFVGGRFTVGNAGSAYAMVLFRMLANGGSDAYAFITEPAIGILAPGQTTLPQYSAGPTDSALVVSGSGARLGDSRNIPPVQAAGGRYYFNQNPTYSAAAGSPATATITVPAGTVTVGSQAVAYSSGSIGVSGTGGTTITYYIYLDDPNWAGGTATMNATTDSTIPYQNDGRIYLGAVNVTYPTSGSGSGSGSGGGGGSYGCVSEDALVLTMRGEIPAREVVPGDLVRVLDYSTMDDLAWQEVTHNRIMPRSGWEIITEGARLELSEETPLTLRDGSAIMPCQLAGEELPTIIDGEFKWQPCFAQPLGREINVCLISCGCQTYAAGMESDKMILTHNINTLPKP